MTDLGEIGRLLVTPLGVAAIGLVVLWIAAVTLSWRYHGSGFEIGVALWMAAYGVNLVVAYLTPADRDTLRLFVLLLVGWNSGLALWMVRDALVRRRRRRRATVSTRD